jgi:hypothetical protein
VRVEIRLELVLLLQGWAEGGGTIDCAVCCPVVAEMRTRTVKGKKGMNGSLFLVLSLSLQTGSEHNTF